MTPAGQMTIEGQMMPDYGSENMIGCGFPSLLTISANPCLYRVNNNTGFYGDFLKS